MVDLDQQLVPTGFDDAGVEFFVILCNGGSILFFHCFDKFLMDVLQFQQILGLAALCHQTGSQRLQCVAHLHAVQKLHFVGSEPLHCLLCARLLITCHKGSAPGADLHKPLCLQQAECFPHGTAPHSQLLAQGHLRRELGIHRIGTVHNTVCNDLLHLLHDRHPLQTVQFCCRFCHKDQPPPL